MRPRIFAWICAGALVGCAAQGPPPVPAAVPGVATPAPAPARVGTPLLLDRSDLRLGTTVQYGRVPSMNELYELRQITGLAHVLLTLPSWPAAYSDLAALERVPPEADLIVILSGFPPTREAAEAWNLLAIPVRLVLVVEGPPPAPGTISDLNTMRVLERVIVQGENPSRSGFERLQRPLSFRVVRE